MIKPRANRPLGSFALPFQTSLATPSKPLAPLIDKTTFQNLSILKTPTKPLNNPKGVFNSNHLQPQANPFTRARRNILYGIPIWITDKEVYTKSSIYYG